MAGGEGAAGKAAEGAVGPDKIGEPFGLVIAYLLPGMVGLWAASYRSPNVKAWMGHAATHEITLGGFLFLMVAAIGVGMVLQALRWGLYEALLPLVCSRKFCEYWYLIRPDYDESRAKEPNVQAALVSLKTSHYRYYECHGAMSIALPAAYGAWLVFGNGLGSGRVPLIVLSCGAALATVATFFAALDSQKRGRKKRIEILGLGTAA